LKDPNDSAFSPNGKRLYVADYGAFGDNGGVFKINPKTKKTTVLTKDPMFEQPDGIAVAPGGRIYVTDLDATDDDGALFRVNPKTGAVGLVASGDGLVDALGVVVEPDGTPIVSSSNLPLILRVNPDNGDQETIADAGDGLTGQGGIARADDGTLYVAGGGILQAVDPETADVDEAATGFDTTGYGLGIDRKGRVLAGDGPLVRRANPASGNVATVGDGFDYVEGQEVVPR
jgi:DNA-binding beta-propeller fold protein YncE